jgi:GDP-L-fucose synthase
MTFKRIVITGGAGFLGKRVIEAFRNSCDAELIVPRREELDLTEQSNVRRLIKENKPDLVVHLAAKVGGIGANQANPGKYCYENLIMGSMLMEECRIGEVSKMITLGTICSYPKFTAIPFSEDDLWLGYPEETNAPYGLAKKMLLVQSQAYRKQYGFNAVYLLSVNLYGPGDNFDAETSHVIPSLIKKCVAAKEAQANEIVLWGDGTPTREFLYVDDAARAIVAAAEKYNEEIPINLGSGSEIAIRDLAQKIAKLCNFTGRITWDTSKPNGQPRRCVDVTRAIEKLSFKAAMSLDEGLERTVNWYVKAQYPNLVESLRTT